MYDWENGSWLAGGQAISFNAILLSVMISIGSISCIWCRVSKVKMYAWQACIALSVHHVDGWVFGSLKAEYMYLHCNRFDELL